MIWTQLSGSFSLDGPVPGVLPLAQMSDPMTPPSDLTSAQAWMTFFQNSVLPLLINLAGALAILLLGWIIAGLVAAAAKNLLKRTEIDDRIARTVTGQPEGKPTNVEQWTAALIFWVIMILAIVAALNVLNLTTVSEPLNNFLNQIFAFLPKLGAAAILVVVAWAVATLAKTVLLRMTRSLALDEKFFQAPETPADAEAAEGQPPFLLSETLANVLYWLILLFFLPLILNTLSLQGQVSPVLNLVDELLAALPRIIKAIAIGAIGWFVARTVRRIVTNLLASTGADQVGAEFGLDPEAGGQPLSWLVGTLVYVLILIPTATAALDALAIPAISGPAISMLDQILSALPQIFTAVVILVAAYVIGKFVGDLVSRILTGVGFNNVFAWLGIHTASETPVADAVESATEGSDRPAVRTPSEIVGVVVLVGIMLFATVAATNVLNLPALTEIVTGILYLFGQILAGLLVFAVGLYLANLAYNLIRSSGSAQAPLLGQTARIAILAFTGAMALQQIGVATSIVNLAFGLLLGAIAVAMAIAFGLGGRDIAADQLREWLDTFKRR